jgi:hypothetical protein
MPGEDDDHDGGNENQHDDGKEEFEQHAGRDPSRAAYRLASYPLAVISIMVIPALPTQLPRAPV